MATVSTPDPATRLSKHLTSQCMKWIIEALSAPTTASTTKVLQMSEIKLSEDNHKPQNMSF